jgi:cytochrome P450
VIGAKPPLANLRKAYTLSALIFQVLENPDMYKKLKAEILQAFPDPDAPLSSARLEQLPYLTAFIQEGLRLHPGALIRQSRIATEQSMVYVDPSTKKQWVSPPGTPVFMDASCNLNPAYWKDPETFRPERWIENPRLDKHLISFSKGTRICLGINLAYSELYVLLGGIVRHYEVYDGTNTQTSPTLALYDTTYEKDIKVRYDYLVPFPTIGSKGVQVKVRPGNPL